MARRYEESRAVKDELTPALEGYLRAIHRIEREHKVARARDISAAQGVASSTVTPALQSLAGRGMVNYEPHELITLTEEAYRRAEQLLIRHRIVRNSLGDMLGLEAQQAVSPLAP
jgi:DtxR family Mn-dependent transcriptional regulator